MANYYTIVTPEEGLPCTEAEARAIRDALEKAQEEEEHFHGFQFVFEGGLGYLEAEESGQFEELPDEALTKVGELIARAGKPYLEFGVAMTCSKLRPGSHGGSSFRLLPDGGIVEPKITWEGC